MARPLVASALRRLALSALVIVVLLPFDPMLSQQAQALPEAFVAFNRQITDFGTFRWMIVTSGLLTILAYVLYRLGRTGTFAAQTRAASRVGLYLFLTIGTSSILVHVLKILVGRGRPALFAEYGAYRLTPFATSDLSHSFPSGHSTAVGALFGALALLAPRFRPLFALGALMIGVSRVVVGAHYPSDVAAGLLLGLWTATVVALVFARQQWLFRRSPEGWPEPGGFSPQKPAGS